MVIKQSEFNYYLEPQLSKNRGFCTMDDFIGDWVVVFKGTNYESLKFKITEGILPGDGRRLSTSMLIYFSKVL